MRNLLLVVVLVTSFTVTTAKPPVSPSPPTSLPVDTDALAKWLRTQLIQHMPRPLVETKHNWGQQREKSVYLRREGPLQWRIEPQKVMKNDGHWQSLSVMIPNPDSITLGIKDLRSPEEGKLLFDVYVGADVDLQFQQQLWSSGLRLYSGESRGRCHAAVLMRCEMTTKWEHKPGQFIPSALMRFRATEAQLFYDKLVIEHTLGVGGDAAKKLGETAHSLMKRFKPNLESELLAKANAAIVKASDSKEIRLSWDRVNAIKK